MNQPPASTAAPPEVPKRRSVPRWLVPALAALIIIAAAIVLALALGKKDMSDSQGKSADNQQAITGPKNFVMLTDGSPVTYAGTAVYDACGLVPFDTIRKNVKSYQQILDMNGTDKKPRDALTIEHSYVDRNIPAALGQDGQPRPTGQQIGGQGPALSAISFINSADSSCWYGQGDDLSIGSGQTFVKVFITQPPTPLSQDLISYLATLQKAGSEAGIDIYVEPQTDGAGFFTGIVANIGKGTAVFVKASTREVAQAATVAVSQTLSKPAKAPMNLRYPLAWADMPNPCTLFSAANFQQLSGKPASALAEDTMFLNEVGGRVMQRSCKRLEVERLDGSPISETYATVRLASDVSNAKKYVETIKSNKDRFQIAPLKQKIALADDAYVAVGLTEGQPSSYELHMRLGKAIIILAAATDEGLPVSADQFAAKMLPFAKTAAERYKNKE